MGNVDEWEDLPPLIPASEEDSDSDEDVFVPRPMVYAPQEHVWLGYFSSGDQTHHRLQQAFYFAGYSPVIPDDLGLWLGCAFDRAFAGPEFGWRDSWARVNWLDGPMQDSSGP